MSNKLFPALAEYSFGSFIKKKYKKYTPLCVNNDIGNL